MHMVNQQLTLQRNVANQFRPDDDSANGLLEYAVGPVGVEHGKSPVSESAYSFDGSWLTL